MVVESTIDAYEVNGTETKPWGSVKLRVQAHPIWRDRVVLVTPDGSTYAVEGDHLQAAITNAKNCPR